MTGAHINPSRWMLVAGALALLLVGVGAASAQAATYGTSTFTGSAEGWKTTNATCSTPLPLACSSTGEYDGTAGNPAGSLAGKGTILLSVAGLFKADTTFESPTFTVGDGGEGAVNLQRAFAAGGTAELNAQLSYTATLVDKTNGQQQKAVTESGLGASAFASKSGGVSLVAGHSYAVVVESEISASVVGLLGSATVRFDNVSVTGPGANPGENPNGGNGGNGGGGGAGANGLTDSRLESLIRSSLISPVTVKGKRMFVKAKCPAKVGVACRVTVQGMVKKGKPATTARTSKIAKAKAKQLVLKVKPKAKSKVAKRKSLLFKETVRAGKATATVYKTLKLIRR